MTRDRNLTRQADRMADARRCVEAATRRLDDGRTVVASIGVRSIPGLIPAGGFRLGFDKFGRASLTRYAESTVVFDERPTDPVPVPAVKSNRWKSQPAQHLDRRARRLRDVLDDDANPVSNR